MQIDIEFDSCWQNSFLSGNDDKSLGVKNKRKYIATTQSKEKDKVKEIDKSTVLGLLCRLIGDQRRLHQTRDSDDYYFKDMEDSITFNVSKGKHNLYSLETVYLINKDADKIGQSCFLGTIPNDCPWFFSESSAQLWSILYLSIDGLLDFILDDKAYVSELNKENKYDAVQPRELLHRITVIQAMDKIETLNMQIHDIKAKRKKEQDKLEKCIIDFEKRKQITEKVRASFLKKREDINKSILELDNEFLKLKSDKDLKQLTQKLIKAVEILDEKFPDKKNPEKSYLQTIKNKEKEIIVKDAFSYAMNLYAGALYIQIERMMGERTRMDYILNNKHKIQGFSKRGFNGVRDFINPMTGGRKQAVGTPFPLTKATGKLEIIIDVDRSRAKYINDLIEGAGVSSFYLGKKGLAYVSNISTREVRR